ncbi:PrsW family glutamic-type intramembrane protease [Streptomyces sp. NPDC001634]|uniref:PrsW family glutamic-type intramembrane protease n=1 Tax=Streptomyces sp. NPDC001634 TaxID=3154390 RepID=UPI00331DDD11
MIGKGAGVALIFLLRRRYFDSVVSGIVIGAATGIGFNFTESIEYTNAMNGANAGFQYRARQSAGLMAAHTAFTAVTGAGFGIARQLSSRARQTAVIAIGPLTAASAHFCNNAVMGYLSRRPPEWFPDSEAFTVLVVLPAELLLLQGPLVVLYVLLLRRGLRSQACGLAMALRTLPASARDAITADEAAALLSPARRFGLKVDALRAQETRRQGISAYRRLACLHAAQLDLATERWHGLRGEQEPGAPDEDALRTRILRLKDAPAHGALPPPPACTTANCGAGGLVSRRTFRLLSWCLSAIAGAMLFLLLTAGGAAAGCGSVTYGEDGDPPSFEPPASGCESSLPEVSTAVASALALVATALHLRRLYLSASQTENPELAKPVDLVTARAQAARDAGFIDAGRVPVEVLESGDRVRGRPFGDTGYEIRTEDLEFLGLTEEQVEAWQRFGAPLGMTPKQFKEFTADLREALAADGLDPENVDIRLQGSSAQFFSGSHKDFPTEEDLGRPAGSARPTPGLDGRPGGPRPPLADPRRRQASAQGDG